MEQTFQALGGILLKSIPTVVLLLLLHFYLKAMLLQAARWEGAETKRAELNEWRAQGSASKVLLAADQKQQEYEAKFREARAEVYRAQEEDPASVAAADQAGQICGSAAAFLKQSIVEGRPRADRRRCRRGWCVNC